MSMSLSKCVCGRGDSKCCCRIVLISDFCRQYGVRQPVQRCFGLHNDGVRRISQEEFENAKRALRKRVSEETPAEKRVCLVKEVEGGAPASYSDPPGLGLMYADSLACWHEKTSLHGSAFQECLNGITLISSSCGNTLEPESDRFFLLQSEEYTKDSSPPVDFSFNGA